MPDLTREISFQTTRSGGKGGQNVNKVETAVIGTLHVPTSQILTEDQKKLILEKLFNRINIDGYLVVKSQIHRTQLANKDEVIKKVNILVNDALIKKKLRIATKISKAVIEKRLEAKKKKADIKTRRKKYRPGDY